eukprot:TRINITY_DN8725_c0_g1_i1.p1 TRINITY_DN8725_c0_g1~~TRINITY_DN8725_c0_g1_i1.p1  ORF type:complete len:566 (+),score=78.20 TRINITY_DN8725_c0_g1_i1:75-1772(+)
MFRLINIAKRSYGIAQSPQLSIQKNYERLWEAVRHNKVEKKVHDQCGLEVHTLPPDTFWYSGDTRHLFVRKCWKDLWQITSDQYDKYKKITMRNPRTWCYSGVLLLGSPGIGKSMFNNFLLSQIAQKFPEHTIALDSASFGDSTLVFSENKVYFENRENLEDLPRPLFYLFDSMAGAIKIQPMALRETFAFITSYPNLDNYKAFYKQYMPTQLFMPLWTKEELKAALPYIHVNLTPKELDNHFASVNGIIRSYKNPEYVKEIISRWARSHPDPEGFLKYDSTYCNQRASETTHDLLVYDVPPVDLKKTSLRDTYQKVVVKPVNDDVFPILRKKISREGELAILFHLINGFENDDPVFRPRSWSYFSDTILRCLTGSREVRLIKGNNSEIYTATFPKESMPLRRIERLMADEISPFPPSSHFFPTTKTYQDDAFDSYAFYDSPITVKLKPQPQQQQQPQDNVSSSPIALSKHIVFQFAADVSPKPKDNDLSILRGSLEELKLNPSQSEPLDLIVVVPKEIFASARPSVVKTLEKAADLQKNVRVWVLGFDLKCQDLLLHWPDSSRY